MNNITGTNSPDNEIIETKRLRQALDAVLQDLKKLVMDETANQAKLHLQNSIMWLGMHLKELATPTPYPNSYNPANTIVDPTADNLKL
jgi:hypothetical protein